MPLPRPARQTGDAVVSTRGAPTRSQALADSPSLMMIVLVGAIGVLLYTIFLFDFSHHGDWPAFLLVLVGESFIILQAVISLWTILNSGDNPRGYAFNAAQQAIYGDRGEQTQAIGLGMRYLQMHLHDFPITIDVFITTYGEDLDVIRRTVTAALAMDGLHSTYVLDDGKSPEVRELTERLGATYIAREGNAHAKAGNVNHALGKTDGEFFVILDADFVPSREFLYETIPFFADPTVAFVQTPQVYGNLHGLISRGAGYMQTVFYRLVQPGKNRFNAAFCVGTNVVFRRRAVTELGGIWQESKSEDVWTSLKLHERGWRSVYIDTELAVGETPETIEAYTKQQLRWATGGFEILFWANPMGRGRRLTLDQRVQYLGTATFYLVGVAPLLLVMVPPLQIFFGLSPIDPSVPPSTWLLYYAGFYIMQVVVALYTIGSFRWETLMLSSASFPIYTKALFNALLRRDQGWNVTGRKGTRNSPFEFIIPQVLCFVFLAATSAVGAWQAFANRSLSLALVWNTLNTLVLGAFLVTAMREARQIHREARRQARDLSADPGPAGAKRVNVEPVDADPAPAAGQIPAPRTRPATARRPEQPTRLTRSARTSRPVRSDRTSEPIRPTPPPRTAQPTTTGAAAQPAHSIQPGPFAQPVRPAPAARTTQPAPTTPRPPAVQAASAAAHATGTEPIQVVPPNSPPNGFRPPRPRGAPVPDGSQPPSAPIRPVHAPRHAPRPAAGDRPRIPQARDRASVGPARHMFDPTAAAREVVWPEVTR